MSSSQSRPTIFPSEWAPSWPVYQTTCDGQSRDQLVVVPAQFRATSSAKPTVGTQRLYSDLQFEIYHAPLTATDFIAPSVWQVEAISSSLSIFISRRVISTGRPSHTTRLPMLILTWANGRMPDTTIAGRTRYLIRPATSIIARLPITTWARSRALEAAWTKR